MFMQNIPQTFWPYLYDIIYILCSNLLVGIWWPFLVFSGVDDTISCSEGYIKLIKQTILQMVIFGRDDVP